jgi:hypothetical protein
MKQIKTPKTGYTRRLVGLYPADLEKAKKEAKRKGISFSQFIRDCINK